MATLIRMGEEPFLGSEAVSSGGLTPYALRRGFSAIHRDVYLATSAQVTAVTRAKAAWLWTRREGVVAGQSAAALHGAKWVDDRSPAQIIHGNRHPPAGIQTWADRFDDDEVVMIDGMLATSPARTALDIACRYELDSAVAKIDALARAANLKMGDVELLAQATAAGEASGERCPRWTLLTLEQSRLAKRGCA